MTQHKCEACGPLMVIVEDQEREIERLRRNVQFWMNYATGQNIEANDLAIENERLRNYGK